MSESLLDLEDTDDGGDGTYSPDLADGANSADSTSSAERGQGAAHRRGNRSTYDVLIVGAGVAGSVFAHELAGLGLRILILEKGRHYTDHRSQFVESEPAMWERTWPNQQYEVAGNAFTGAPNFGHGVGGGSLVWTNVCLRFHRHDFRMRTEYGAVGGADVEDWPIALDDLAPYYSRAEDQLGVAAGQLPWDDQRQTPYPFPAHAPYRSSVALQGGMQRLGLRSAAGPVAVASRTAGGRNACLHCGFCRSSCRIDAKFQADQALLRPLLDRGEIELRAEVEVVRITQGANPLLASGVEYVDLKSGERHRVRCRLLLVCNNPIETPRLFLNSATRFHPRGLGNNNGLVGRYLFGHVGVVGAGRTSNCLNSSIGYNMGNVVTLDYSRPRAGEAIGGIVIASLQGAGAGVLAVDPYRQLWGRTLKDAMRGYNRNLYAVAFGEGLPVHGNRVTLSSALTDRHGAAQARIEYRWHANDLAVDGRARQALTAVLTAAGAESIQLNPQPFEAHLGGTMRMGQNPWRSVTDPWGRVHGLSNVYVGGASQFVTGSSSNPTLTLHALALRTAAHLRRRFRLQRR